MLKVKIQVSDIAKGIRSEIELEESDKMSKLAIMHGVFKIFGVKEDLLEFIDGMQQVENVYTKFMSEITQEDLSQLQPDSNSTTDHQSSKSSEEIKRDMINAYKENSNEENKPDHYITGIKYDKDGKPKYRLHYKCPACDLKKNFYVYENTKRIECYQCYEELEVLPAHPFEKRDSMGNFFRAGDYIDPKLS